MSSVFSRTSLPEVTWNWIQGLLVGMLALIGADVVAGIIIGSFGISINSQLFHESSISGNFIFYAFSRLLGLAGIAAFLKGKRVSWHSLGFRKFKPLSALGYLVLAILIFSALTIIAFVIISLLAPGVNLDQAQDVMFSTARSRPELLLAFMALVVIAPVAEETIFRGFMLPAFAKRFGWWPAVLITSVLFGAVHWQLNVGIVTFIMALLLGWLYRKTGSLWPAILFHSLKNLIAFLFIF